MRRAADAAPMRWGLRLRRCRRSGAWWGVCGRMHPCFGTLCPASVDTDSNWRCPPSACMHAVDMEVDACMPRAHGGARARPCCPRRETGAHMRSAALVQCKLQLRRCNGARLAGYLLAAWRRLVLGPEGASILIHASARVRAPFAQHGTEGAGLAPAREGADRASSRQLAWRLATRAAPCARAMRSDPGAPCFGCHSLPLG